jgi:hypothetical protein
MQNNYQLLVYDVPKLNKGYLTPYLTFYIYRLLFNIYLTVWTILVFLPTLINF